MDRTDIQVHVLTGKVMFCSQPQNVSIEGPLDTKKPLYVCIICFVFKGLSLALKKHKLQVFKKYLVENFCTVKAFIDSKKKRACAICMINKQNKIWSSLL